jgi:hypothetical protein
VCAEIDLDDSEAAAGQHGKKDARDKSPANAQFAKRLRSELAALLEQPLTRTGKFITGHSAATAACAGLKNTCPSAGAEQSDPSGDEAVVDDVEVQQAGTCKKKTMRKAHVKTLAQQQACALQKALLAKHMKKLGKMNSRTQSLTPMRQPGGVSALQVLRGVAQSSASG